MTYTAEEYLKLKEELKSLVESSSKYLLQIKAKGKKKEIRRGHYPKYAHLLPFILNNIPEKLKDGNYNLQTIIYWIIHDLTDFPLCNNSKCPHGRNAFKNKNVVNVYVGYRKSCCRKCATEAEETQEKIHKTCMEKYNNLTFLGSDYGIRKIKQIKLERYGDENYNNPEKLLHTLHEKYGNSVNSSFQIPESIEKSKQTKLERYGNDHYVNVQKAKQTNLQRYGHESFSQTSEYLEKTKQTCLKHYGVEYSFQSENNKEKSKQTRKKKYGDSLGYSEANLKSWKLNKRQRLEKQNETKRRNNSFNKSKPEEEAYILLKEYYPDIIRQYSSEEYPFYCDFFIPNKKLYIECNFHWTHGNHHFNENDENDLKKKSELIEKAKNSKFYLVHLKVWTEKDVKKYNVAKENNLNYLVFWNINQLKCWINNEDKLTLPDISNDNEKAKEEINL